MKPVPFEMLEAPALPLCMPAFPGCWEPIDPLAPASNAMTDFRNGPVIVAQDSASIEATLAQMKSSGARFHFVIDERGSLVGSVTSYDILGEKPMQYMQSVGCAHNTCAWRDVLVRDIMERVEDWRVIDHSRVGHLRVREVDDLLSRAGRRYLVVVERHRGGAAWSVRGLFSRARIQLLLGTDPAGPAGDSPAARS